MNLNLIELNTKGRVDFEIKPDMSSYKDSRIKEIKELNVNGSIIDNGTLDYEIILNIKGEIILYSSINGSDVPYKLDMHIDDFINNLVEIYKNSSNSLDILPIIWENILLEIPIRTVNSQDKFEKTSGNGWEIVEE